MILIDVRFIPLMSDVAKTIFYLQNVEVSCECYYKYTIVSLFQSVEFGHFLPYPPKKPEEISE